MLYNFCSQPSCSDGYEPRAALIFDKEVHSTAQRNSVGLITTVVFKLIPPAKGQTVWTPTVLHSFVGGDGANPIFGGLIFDKRGALYGTTYRGGSANGGTVFKLIPPAKGLSAWTETIPRSFSKLVSSAIKLKSPLNTASSVMVLACELTANNNRI